MKKKLDDNTLSFFQKSLPLISSILLLLLSYSSVNIFMLDSVHPDLGFICIYFWMLHRPDLFGMLSVVVIGLLDMAITSVLPGASLFGYLIFYVIIYNTQKIFNAKSFVVVWCGFMAISFVAVLFKWLVVSIYYSKFLPLLILIFGYSVSIALYPVVSAILVFIQNRFIQDEGL